MIEFERAGRFDFRSEEYERLFARSSATAFQHPIWLDRVYARLVSQSDAEPIILTGRRNKDNRLIFVLPLVRRRSGLLETVEYADMGVSDYNAPIVDRCLEAKIGGSPSLDGELRAAIYPAMLGRIQKMRGDTLAGLGLEHNVRYAFMGFHAHEVRLHGPFSAWRKDAFSQSFSRFLDKKRKALAKKGAVEFKELDDAGSIRSAFATLRSFRKTRWADDLLKKEHYFDFYTDVAVQGKRAGLARTQMLTCGGRPVALLFGLAHAGQFQLLLVGFNIDEFRNFSVGKLIMESSIEDAIGRGETIYDFTIGDEAYKAEFGTRAMPMYTAWLGSRPAAALARTACGALSQLKLAKRKRALRDGAPSLRYG